MSSNSSPRVVSLLSSATEILHSLGGFSMLVGRSHECDFPPEVAALPCCSEPLIDVHGDSASIDRQVKESARNALSIYRVFDHVIEDLRPTHILTQVQCEVCAVSLKDVEKAVARMSGVQTEVISLNPFSLESIWEDFRRVGSPLGLDSEGTIATYRKELKRYTRAKSGLRVACIEWIDPLMAAGNWTPELIEMAGATNLFGKAGQHSPWLTWQELVSAKPDVTVVAPCGFSLARTLSEIDKITGHPSANDLGRIYAADGNTWFNRPGPSVVETLQILEEVIYQSGNAFENRCWKRVA